MTARDLCRAMLRDDVAPRLRALGRIGSGNRRFDLPDPQTWVQFGFELSHRDTASERRFTLNVSVVDRAAWTALRTDQPALPSRPNPVYAYGRDTWWCITTNRGPDLWGLRLGGAALP